MLKTISDIYKFYLYHPINGLIEVFPHNPTIEWMWEKNKEESQAFTRKKLNTELVFKKTDFFLLYDLERSNYKCEKISFEVHRECSGIFTLFHTGYIALIDGDYDREKCIVRIKLRQDDEYNCILKEWTKEKDFIGGVGAPPSVADVRILRGEIEYEECGGSGFVSEIGIDPTTYIIRTDCLTNVETYAFLGNFIVNIGFTGQVFYKSKFARERLLVPIVNGFSPSPGPEWTFLNFEGSNGVWVRPLPFTAVNELITTPIKNGRKLNDVIQYLVQSCGLTYVSDFFNRNPDATNPQNFAYDYADNFYKDLVIWQKSDVKRQPRVITDSSGNTTTLPYVSATKALIKLKDLLNWMNTMYNVQWNIIGNQFRVEHYTYWNSEKQNIIDLTSNSRIKGLYKYKYEVEDLPKSEKWIWMEESDKLDFDGLPILYSETCSYDEDDVKDEEYNISKITTNLEYIILNPSKISDDGFVIASTENGTLQSDICKITNTIKLNGPNSLSNLIYYLHRHGRPQRFGKMNGIDETFFSPKPKRQGPEILVPMCCDEVESFDTNYRVKTQMGWGDIVSAKLKDPVGLMTISLLHE